MRQARQELPEGNDDPDFEVIGDGPEPPVEEPPVINGHPEVSAQTYAEFRAATEADKAMEWVLKPFLPPTGLVVIAGEQKSGKTIWVAWLTAQVLAKGMRVLFVELEGPRENLLERLDLFCQDPTDRLGLSIRWRCGDKLDGKGLVTLLALVEKYQPNFIIVDPLFRAMSGDENESKVWRPIVESLEALSTLGRCPVAVLHHVRKAPNEGRDAITSSDVRGSSALLGAAAVVAIVHKKERTADGTARFDVVCADSWYAPFPIQRCLVTFGGPPEEAMQVMTEDEAKSPTGSSRAGKLRVSILQLLIEVHPHHLSGRQIEAGVRGKGTEVRAALSALVVEGQVLRMPGERRSFMYWLPGVSAGDGVGLAVAIRSVKNDPSASEIDGTHRDARDTLPDQALEFSSASVRPVPLRGDAVDALTDALEDAVRPPVRPNVDEDEAPPPPPRPLTCLSMAGATRCGKPIEGPGVWCAYHKEKLMAGVPAGPRQIIKDVQASLPPQEPAVPELPPKPMGMLAMARHLAQDMPEGVHPAQDTSGPLLVAPEANQGHSEAIATPVSDAPAKPVTGWEDL